MPGLLQTPGIRAVPLAPSFCERVCGTEAPSGEKVCTAPEKLRAMWSCMVGRFGGAACAIKDLNLVNEAYRHLDTAGR
jgi:hypothetical protein